MRKISIITFVLLAIFIITGCGKKNKEQATGKSLVVTSDQVSQLEEVKTPKTEETNPAPKTESSSTAAGEYILQNFEPNNGTEDFDIYTWDYGKAHPELNEEIYYHGKRSIKTEGDMVGFNFNVREVDMSTFNKIFVYVYDTNGDNTIEITLRDMNDNEHKVWSTEKSRKNQWTKVSVPLSKFKDKIELSRIRNIQIYEWSKGVYYFDNIGIEGGATPPSVVKPQTKPEKSVEPDKTDDQTEIEKKHRHHHHRRSGLILQDFESGNGTEDFDVYFWDYGKAKPSFSLDKPFAGKRCIKTKGDIAGFNFSEREIDMSSYKKIYVYVYDTNGDNTLEMTLTDMKNTEAKVWSTETSKKNQWTKVSIPIDKFKDKIDITKVKNIQIYEWNKGEYYFDNIGVE